MYKVALIGYGRWGKMLLPYLERFFDVKAVFGRSIEKKGRFTNDLDDIFSLDVHALAIATPIGTHYEIAWQVLKHGKHVFCEKPLAREPSLARELDFVATQKRLYVVTDYTYTFSRRLRKIQDDILGNKIGKLQRMTLTLRRNSTSDGVDIYWNLASHMLAVIGMFSDLGNLTFEKTVLIPGKQGIISFTGEVEGQILVDSKSESKETEIVFHGSKNRVVYSELHKEDGLSYAMRYFKGVLDGTIGNSANVKRAISVTDVLWRLENAC